MCDQIDSLEEVKLKSTGNLSGCLTESLQTYLETYINQNNSQKLQQTKEQTKITICIGFRQPYMIKKTSKTEMRGNKIGQVATCPIFVLLHSIIS